MKQDSLHILLVEDSATHAEMIRHALKFPLGRVQLTVVGTCAQARTFLAENLPDLAFIDFRLPDGNGTDLLWKNQEEATFPAVLLTGEGDEKVAVEAMKGGALDYLVKTVVSISDLPHVVERSLKEWKYILDRREIKKALRESEERYRTLYHNTPAMLHSIDAEGRLVSVSNFWLETLGYERHEVIGRKSTEFLTEASRRSAEEVGLPEFFRTGVAKDVSYQFVKKSGEVIDVLLSATAERDEKGHFKRSLAVVTDVTDRVRAEKALRRNEEKYRMLFNNMREAAAIDEIVVDETGRPVDWRVLDVNPAYEEVFQLSAKEAIGRRASEIYGESHMIEDVLGDYDRAPERDVPVPLEIYSSSTKKHLWISVCPMGEGRFATLTRDVTKRKRYEDERERLLAELHATINAIADALVIYTADGEIVHMNPAAERLLGYSPKQRRLPLEKRISRFFVETPDGKPFDLARTMSEVFAGKTVQGVVTVLRQPDGKAVWLSSSAAPIRTPDGHVVGAVGTATDITILHELQELRDIYIHTISHDLRIPLTIISGYSQMLEEKMKEDGFDETARLNVEGILDGVDRMTLMIDDLVDTARMEGGQLKLEKRPLPFGQFVDRLTRSSARVIDNTRLKIDIPCDLPPVSADEARLERILVNLLTNAQKYSPGKSPIRLAAHRQDSHLLVSVADAGNGIDPEDLPHIFERFYRVKGSSRSDKVGLGLYTTKMLVEAHGGSIWAESKPSVGSTFFFTLPIF